MDVFHLQSRKDLSSIDPWKQFYNGCYDNFVIVAETELEARELAHINGGLENYQIPGVHPWLDSKYSSCTLIIPDGRKIVTYTDKTE